MLQSFIEGLGLLGIYAVIFAESGLFFGFFLPGDSLLFSAGLLASAGYFNIFYLFLGSFACAVAGDTVGYWTGQKLGPRIFSSPDSFFFNRKNLDKTSAFYAKYGKKTIVVARFVPIVRTFAPIMAGAGKMEYRTFGFYNLLGGLLWTGLMTWGGYLLGDLVPNIEHYVLPIIAGIILLSFMPIIKEFWANRSR